MAKRAEANRHEPADAAPPEHAVMSSAEPILIAYRISPALPLRLIKAPGDRAWMDNTDERFAYRCLPLLIANQAGWFLLNSHALRATWDGGDKQSALRLEYLSGEPPYPAVSHFGHGILTWRIPYLFRTPPGYNLLVRGPANWPKDGAFPLEGIVEADWSVATFTMNWKLMAVGRPITFEVDDPLCMLVPHRRGELEAFRPQLLDIRADPELSRGFQQWTEDRARFLVDLRVPGAAAVKERWQRHYFRGVGPDGMPAPAHETKLRLRDFADPNGYGVRDSPLVVSALSSAEAFDLKARRAGNVPSTRPWWRFWTSRT